MRVFFLLIAFLLVLSCNTQKEAVIAKFKLGKNVKGEVKTITTNVYYSTEISPSNLIEKSDVKKLEEKSFRPTKALFDAEAKKYIFNKEPQSIIAYDKKGRIIRSREYRLTKKLVLTKNFTYKKNSVLFNMSYHRLQESKSNYTSLDNGVKTEKKSLGYSILNKSYALGSSEFTYEGANVIRVIAKDENGTVTLKDVFEYNADHKIISTQKKNGKNTILKQIDYAYLSSKGNNYSVVKTEDDSNFLITEETTYTKKLNIISAVKKTEFDKNKKTYAYTNKTYSYEFPTDKEKPILHQIKTIKSTKKHTYYKSYTTYYANGLIKEFRSTSEFFEKKNKNFYYEYDFDRYGNWIAKYQYDRNKGGITQIALRTFTYY